MYRNVAEDEYCDELSSLPANMIVITIPTTCSVNPIHNKQIHTSTACMRDNRLGPAAKAQGTNQDAAIANSFFAFSPAS